MPSARIYQMIKSNMQSGRAHTQEWVLEFDAPQGIRADPLTGWQGGGATQGQLKLSFPSEAAAIDYAEREGVEFHVVPPAGRRLKIQAYADNFQGGVKPVL